MSLPAPGKYLATVIESGVTEKAGKCPQAVILFECVQHYDGGQWVDAAGERITAYQTLINRNGECNRITAETLHDTFGWTGTISEIEGFVGAEAQITVEDEADLSGNLRRKVRYINNRDSTGKAGIAKADPQQVQSLDAKYGAQFRAILGTTAPATATKASATAPAKPKTATDPMKVAAWAAWKAKHPQLDKAATEAGFRKAVRTVCGCDIAQMTPVLWQALVECDFTKPVANPIEDAPPQFNDDELPF